jgi:phosphoribosylformylglycinamidine synthase I
MKIAVIQFPGSTGERELIQAVERAGMTAEIIAWGAKPALLSAYDGFIIGGGFSFDDLPRAGVIAAREAIIAALQKESESGKPLLGIGNGAQILVESGLVPGLSKYEAAIALTTNKRVLFDRVEGLGLYNAWIHIRCSDRPLSSAFTLGLTKNNILSMPVSHEQGRFLIPDELLKEMNERGMAVFHYCTEDGELRSEYPVNPNGSVNNIAAVVTAAGNVMAMMPHPERSSAGDAIFISMRDYIAEKETFNVAKLNYQVEKPVMPKLNKKGETFLLSSVKADRAAIYVQSQLDRLSISVKVSCYDHWEVVAEGDAVKKVMQCGALFDVSKLSEDDLSQLDSAGDTACLLVREKEDIVGLEKFQLLANHFEVDGIRKIVSGRVWVLSATSGEIDAQVKKIIKSSVLFNAVSHECFVVD